ncbi:hypothetical protein DP73_15420 [Desulfosporosinus sp. HMP52]|uniref:hypothetical protein n=1 Tax=Desulfosporosinus sp. HMP52 TaxID=1487923 RepID=UPI00051F9C8F|nr:hypothetical protein [Desulfosporosinus sp. HMP52]KGK86818.1 hypothetical protein DP73_15420 [Desulfosporosinus sp. HMP52]
MFFVIICMIVWILYTFVMQRRLKEEFRLFKALLPLVILSLIVSLSLGVNYVASAIPSINDGISIHTSLAHWIIGEDSWSINLFKNYFDYSIWISLILLALYSGLRIWKD